MTTSSGPGRPHRHPARSQVATPYYGTHDRTARLPRTARLVESSTLTSTGTVRLGFDVLDDQPFDFVPGQFVAIDMDDSSNGYRRSPYCLMDGSEQDRAFELLIRRVDDGPVSLFLCDLTLGDVISFRGPSGHSMLPPDADVALVLLATGVGVGPCHCLVRYLHEIGSRRSIRLFWGLRLVSDICLLRELDALAAGDTGFEYAITLSAPDADWPGLRGRVTESVPPLLESLSGTRFYLVSNGEMIAEMSRALQNLGVHRDQIYEESFFNHRSRPDDDAIAEVENRFVADDVVRPFERLQRELSQYGTTWRGTR